MLDQSRRDPFMLAIAVSALSALQWQQVGYPINGSEANDHFGFSTTLSNNGSILAIGNSRTSTDTSPPKVYIQSTTSGSPTWDPLTVDEFDLLASSGAPKSVHFSTDAEFLAIGYPMVANGQGYVTLFEHTPEGQYKYTKLHNSELGTASSDNKGSVVVMFENSSGTIGFLESAPYRGNNNIGDVYRATLNTEQTAIERPSVSIKPSAFTSDQNIDDYFGLTMDASDDGDTVVVCTNAGRGYFFTRGTNNQYSASGEIEEFGRLGFTSVSMSSNGQRAAFGDWNSDSVQIWDFTSPSWQKSVTIPSPDTGSAQNFGYSVSLSADGKRLAVGDSGSTTSKGRVYIFHEQSSGSWVQVGQTIEGDTEGDGMGAHVTMSGDGTTVAVSAPDYNNGDYTEAGRVKIYQAVISDDDSDDDGLSTGAVVGIAVGATAGAAAIGATAYYAVPSLFTGGKYKPVDQPFL